jgi:hypothetical protein
MPAHFLLRIGDGNHFNSSSVKSIWGINSVYPWSKMFISSVQEGDLMWFVTGKSRGKIVAVATYKSMNKRIVGPLISLTHTNVELGWTETDGAWDTEIHYKDLYNLTESKLYSEIKSPLVIRKYSDKCKVDLPAEYPNIVRYLKVAKSM